MKKILSIKNILSTVLCLTMVFTMFANISAAEPEHIDPYEGESYKFISIDDETGLATPGIPLRLFQKSGTIWTTTWYAGIQKIVETITATGDSLIKERYVRDLTTSWAKASQYTWTKSQTVSWTVNGDATWGETVKLKLGLSASRTTSYGVGVTIPADSTRDSKLVFKSDFFRQDYRYTMVVDGETTQNTVGWTESPTADSYLRVQYKQQKATEKYPGNMNYGAYCRDIRKGVLARVAAKKGNVLLDI